MSEPIHILSLGAGVQSSTMALMAAAGEITPMPDHAVFADVGNEERATYQWLDYLAERLPFPIVKVRRGNLGDDLLASLRDPKKRCATPPFFVSQTGYRYVCANCGSPCKETEQCEECGTVEVRQIKSDGVGVLWRQCTSEYKLQPIRAHIRNYLKTHGRKTAKVWIGISMDEAHRMKESGVKYLENIWPLIDRRISRQACLRWMKERSHPEPPKSACFFCPYHSDAYWQKMKNERAVEFERAVRGAQETIVNGAKIFGKIFLHRSAQPLDQVVFDPMNGQPELFGNECEGMCGV